MGGGVRLNATASTVALLFFGWLWGGMGLVLGIPILAVLKCIFDNVPSTRRIGMFSGYNGAHSKKPGGSTPPGSCLATAL